ncbi:DUF4192 domain-containing protein [Corynebacterium sp. MSK008]|uniref:DUF4192 domain-containing protein n=1 Tax=Corynebacterium sp. MSK008 TaxID=3050188 RepID=UPI00254E8243|nr:DUF4192 domain-containing protein [Corynebacterium sp. MSK008]
MEPARGCERLTVMDIQPQPHETNHPTSPITPYPSADLLRSPAQLIASIPAALGYFPNEAVVLINAYSPPGATPTLEIGAYLDADVGNTESIQRALQRIPLVRHVATFAVIVTRVPESQMVAVAAEGLRMAADAFGEIVEACWIVSEIADGTHYQLLFGPDPGTADAVWDWGADYEQGTVTSVAAAEPMRPLIDHGVLPELHKSDVFGHFEPVFAPDVEVGETLARSAYRRGAELFTLVRTDPQAAREQITQACGVYEAAPDARLIDTDGSLIVDDVFTSLDDVELVAAMLTGGRLRDFLIGDALNRPRAAGAVFLTIARNFSGEIRANALCLWGMVALSQGLIGWASTALACAEDELPGHNLSALLSGVMDIGQGPKVLELCRKGCLDTWRELDG